VFTRRPARGIWHSRPVPGISQKILLTKHQNYGETIRNHGEKPEKVAWTTVKKNYGW
jgi:hypothetical protein